MKTKIVACPLIVTFLGSMAIASADTQAELSLMQADAIATYLSNLDQETRKRIASKLYYLDPNAGQNESKKTLLDELTRQGRVSKDDIYSTGPRTISTESGF